MNICIYFRELIVYTLVCFKVYTYLCSMFNPLTSSLMYVNFRFKSAAAAEEAAVRLPVGCNWKILRDCTHDAYLEVSEDYEDYVEKHLYRPYKEQKGGKDE